MIEDQNNDTKNSQTASEPKAEGNEERQLEIEHMNHANKENMMQNSDILLIDFYATWCGPCTMMMPKLAEVQNHDDMKEKLKIVKVNVEEEVDIATEHGIQTLPTFVLLKSGAAVDKKMGMMESPEMMTWIKEHME